LVSVIPASRLLTTVDVKSEKLVSLVTRHARWLVMVRKPKRYYVKPECGLVISPPKLLLKRYWLKQGRGEAAPFCRRTATSIGFGCVANKSSLSI
jgi:hypothetical protein